MKKVNSELVKVTGMPACASEGVMNHSKGKVKMGDLGMGKYNPRKGENTTGKYQGGVGSDTMGKYQGK